MPRKRVLALTITVAMAPAGTYAAGGPGTVMLECHASENQYKNGIRSWPDDTQVYYRVELGQSGAVVSYKGSDGNYSSATRYDLRTYPTSYELTGWWNKDFVGTYIDIDRLNGNFSIRVINDDDSDYIMKGFGSCFKIDDTPKF